MSCQEQSSLKFVYRNLWERLIYIPDFRILGFWDTFCFVFFFPFQKTWNFVALIGYLPWIICRYILALPWRLIKIVLSGIFGCMFGLFFLCTALWIIAFIVVFLFTNDFNRSLHALGYIDEVVLPMYEDLKELAVSFVELFSYLIKPEVLITVGGYTLLALVISIIIWRRSKKDIIGYI